MFYYRKGKLDVLSQQFLCILLCSLLLLIDTNTILYVVLHTNDEKNLNGINAMPTHLQSKPRISYNRTFNNTLTLVVNKHIGSVALL